MEETVNDKSYCPLCKSGSVEPFFQDNTRHYVRCNLCKLIFVPAQYWLNSEEERSTYDLHENDPYDQAYRSFLSRLVNPLLEKLPSNQQGLDFGCGPGPALPLMMEEHGHHMERYDPFYANNPSVLNRKFDFICVTEVVEHLRDPDLVFSTLFSMINPGGWLGIMTKLISEHHDFATWHYIRDMTHICFYHRNTFTYLAQRFNANVTFIEQDVVLLQKPEPNSID